MAIGYRDRIISEQKIELKGSLGVRYMVTVLLEVMMK
jgi:hypothetical protein